VPKELVGISVAISHTFTTRVRVRILKQMAKAHTEFNNDQTAFVTNYHPRPLLKIKHQSGKVDAYLYFEAVKRFSHYLSPEFLAEEASYAKGNVGVDNLRSIFIILSPDHVLPGLIPSPAVAGSKRGNEHLASDSIQDAPAAGPAQKKQVGFVQARGKGGRGGKTSRRTSSQPSVSTSNQFAALMSSSPALDKSYTSSGQPEPTTNQSEAASGESEEESDEGNKMTE